MEKVLPDELNGGTDDFESLMEQSLRAPRPGDVLVGRVLAIARDSVIIDINYKCEGQAPLGEFLDAEGNVTVKEGDEVDVYFEGTETEQGTVIVSHAKAEKFKVWRELERAYKTETLIEGLILGKVKGGLKVDIGVPAFLPGSHVDIRPARNLDRYIGQRARFQILKFNRARANVVVSRRTVLERERASLKEQTLRLLQEGVVLEGTVKNITDYGAFVELEKGVEGLIHVSEMTWSKRTIHPSKVVGVGDSVEVQVLGVDEANRRISLGLKQTEPNPWRALAEKHPVGSHVRGKVKSITDFGVFIEIEPGIDGLVHISDLSWTKKIRHPSDYCKKGDELEAVVLGIDADHERVSLGVKQVTPDPWQSVLERYPIGSKVSGKVSSVADFGVFVEIEEGIEGLIHVSQLSSERVDKPSSLFKAGDTVSALIVQADPKERRIGLSIRALKQHEEREEMQAYLKREHEAARFSLEDILNEELRLDREEGDRPAVRGKGRDR